MTDLNSVENQDANCNFAIMKDSFTVFDGGVPGGTPRCHSIISSVVES